MDLFPRLGSIRKQKTSKYHAKKCEIDGIKFDSLTEGEFYTYLKQFGDMECHPKITLLPTITWKLDFFHDGKWYDVKGKETAEFKLKLKLWKLFGPGTLVVVRKVPGLRNPWVSKEIQGRSIGCPQSASPSAS